MKNIFDKKITVAVVFFFVGMAAQWSLQKIRGKPAPPASYFSKNITPDEFDQILDQDYEANFFKPISKLAASYGGALGEENIHVQQREDQNYVYYELALNGIESKNLNIQVENGQVSVAAKIDKDSDDGGQHITYHSSFNRSFPAPPNADAQKVEILHEANKMILKFPKA